MRKASLAIMQDLRADQQNFQGLLQETFNGLEYSQAGFSPYNHIRLLKYQLDLMKSRLLFLQDALDQEALKPESLPE